MSNVATEHALHGVAVGRKNDHGSKSLRGTRVAAIFDSVIESVKLAGDAPAGYIRKATRRAIEVPGTVILPRDLTG